MNVFISQPMRGKTDEEIMMERSKAVEDVRHIYPDAVIMDSFFDDNHPATQLITDGSALTWLALSLLFLGNSQKAYFVDGWEDARGCIIEHMCCEEYGIEIIRD